MLLIFALTIWEEVFMARVRFFDIQWEDTAYNDSS